MKKFAVIGDVHGNALEFMRLLRRIEAAGVDAIFQVGDLVDRGPASVECVRIARGWTFTARDGSQQNLRCLLGNHEENHVYAHYKRVLPGRDFVPKVAHPDVQAALTPADFAWLDSLPLWIGFDTANGRRWAVVHGGLPLKTICPGWLGKSKGSVLCRTGYLDEQTGTPLKPYQTSKRFWANEYQGNWGHVFFGHTSFPKIARFAFATGVDCSKMGKVAAMIVDSEASGGQQAQEMYEPIIGWSPKKTEDDKRAWQKHSSQFKPTQTTMFREPPKKQEPPRASVTVPAPVDEEPRRAPPPNLSSVLGPAKPKFESKPDSPWESLGIKDPFDNDWSK